MLVNVFEGVWIGDSSAAKDVDGFPVLNVAHDLHATRATMHVGLIDGPGNEVSAYAAAVCALHALRQKHNVLVCCHTGSRALAVSVMYTCILTGQTWDNVLKMLLERIDTWLPELNEVHRHTLKEVSECVKLS